MNTVTIAILLLLGPTMAPASEAIPDFHPETDLICLHYDHAPDKDDGQSAAADRTVLESIHGVEWIKQHVVAVSGAYGKNAKSFNAASDAVMKAAWDDCGGWVAAHEDRPGAVERLVEAWADTLRAGGDVWVKEGGQSDLTADVLRAIRRQLPDVNTRRRVHVVQHSNWNENQTTEKALAYIRAEADYIRIRDANTYLNKKGGDEPFARAAVAHPRFGPVWRAAFDYYDPTIRLDFSDSGELLHLLGLGEIGFGEFRRRYLSKGS